jgi:pyridoxamine 5'-phosphate oxidase
MNEFKLAVDEPIVLFNEWLKQAGASELNNPNACALATADKSGKPSVRMVLLKGVDERGFVFFSNSESQKGIELSENPNASLCFHWKSLDRQVRVDGAVEKVTTREADAYFESRARESQIGAWASKQSQKLKSRLDLEKRIDQFTVKFGIKEIPRPECWEGYRVIHEKIEFWAEKKFRLHDRYVYRRSGTEWQLSKLYP